MLSTVSSPVRNADQLRPGLPADPRLVAKAREMEGVDPTFFDAAADEMLTRTGAFLTAKVPSDQLLRDAEGSVLGALQVLNGFGTTPRVESLEQAAGQAIDAAAQITAAVRQDNIAVRDAVTAAAHLRMAEQTFGLESRSPTLGLETAQRHVDHAIVLLSSMITQG